MKREIKTTALTRRDFLRAGGLSAIGVAGLAGLAKFRTPTVAPAAGMQAGDHESHEDTHGGMGTVGTVDHEANQFNPHELLYDFDYGEVKEEGGRIIREWQIVAIDREIEIAPGVHFPAWTYGSATSAASRRAGHIVGQVPGPTLRCTEGDRLRIHFTNASAHPHTIHFHGIHSARMDGAPGIGRGIINSGERFTYEFDARPFGCHLYHCHAVPLKHHLHKGLYGAFIIDPDPAKYTGQEHDVARSRNRAYAESSQFNEMVMVMNAFDTNFDGENEVYAVNSIAFGYDMNSPIPIRADQMQRLYLVNLTEFDPINSLHIHANFFNYYDHGTTLTPTHRMIDTVMQCQAQRGILEFSFAGFEPDLYMFHAHQTEFVELGWMSFFDVKA